MSRSGACSRARAGLPVDRRHLRLHQLSGRSRARPRPGHPCRPDDDRRRGPAAGASGWRSSRVTRRSPTCSRSGSTARSSWIPSSGPTSPSVGGCGTSPRRPRAECNACVLMPRLDLKVHRPPWLGRPPQDRRARRARRLGRDRRPPVAQEPHRGTAGRVRLRAVQLGVHGRHGGRSRGARHDPLLRQRRRPGRGDGLGPRPRRGLDARARAAPSRRRDGAGCRSTCWSPSSRLPATSSGRS